MCVPDTGWANALLRGPLAVQESGLSPDYAALPGPAALGVMLWDSGLCTWPAPAQVRFPETPESSQHRRSWGLRVHLTASPGPPWNCFTELHLNLRLTQKDVMGSGSSASGYLLSKDICIPFLCGGGLTPQAWAVHILHMNGLALAGLLRGAL